MIVPGSASPLLLSSAGGYNLTKSLRFRSSASAYLNRTFGTPTDNKKFTWSGWVKRGTLGAFQVLQVGDDSTSDNFLSLRFGDTDTLQCFQVGGGSYNLQVSTSAVFRDPSAWYHIVFIYDSANATSTNRIQFYVNGVLQTVSYAVGPFAINTASQLNVASRPNAIGRLLYASVNYFDGYLAEVNFIDGQALTPSSFGETSTTTGVWIPKKYTGTYGTNGFYLKFTDTTSTSTLGTDFSGNSNTWTVNNISLTAGSTYDSMTDVPTLTNSTTANYCVLSPIASSPLISLTNGNLTAGGTDEASLIGTIGVNSGKWYWEVTVTSGSSTPYLGVSSNSFDKSGVGTNFRLAGISWYGNGNKKAYTATSETSATSNTTGVYGFALDISAGTLAFYFNNSLVLTDTTIPTSGVTLFPLVAHTNSGSNSWNPANFNFGQQPFAYTPPSGFLQLNTFNLPTPTIGATASTTANKYFNAVTYTGAGAGTVITSGFYPDFAWMKNRTAAFSNFVQDSVRGGGVFLLTNTTDADSAVSPSSTFSSTGITINANSSYASNSSYNYVLWAWNANSGSTVTNTAGSINSTVSANTTAGFSVVTYTGNGTAGATVGHGLGVAPNFIIIKCRSNATNWFVGGSNIATAGNGTWSSVMEGLNTTSAVNTGATAVFNSTAPTSSVVTLGTEANANGSGRTFVMYCWAQVAGYSAFGSYTGNGSTDGPFIFTGFRPRYVMTKRSDAIESWRIGDSARSPYNAVELELFANLSNAEENNSNPIDYLSNGFKIRTSSSSHNASGGTYIYMVFAEVPLKFSNAR